MFWRRVSARRAGGVAFGVALAACLLLGLFLRARGFLFSTTPLWLDEAGWARILLSEPLLKPSIRPFGFMTLSWLITKVLGPTEFALRLLPWLAGLVSLFLAVFVARRAFRSPAAQLLLVASLALHPFVIDYAKEFKPYSLSLAFHLGCVSFALLYFRTERLRWLIAALGTGSTGLLFAPDLVFAFPGLYLSVGLTVLRVKRAQHWAVLIGGASATVALLFGLYTFFWSAIDAGGQVGNDYWGRKYDAFYVEGTTSTSRTSWLIRKYLESAAFPGERRIHFEPPVPVSAGTIAAITRIDSTLWMLLHLLGIGVLIARRRVREVLLLGLPLLVLAACNQLKLWPAGAFRTNLFSLAYTCTLAGFAVDRRERTGWSGGLPALILVILPLLLFEREWHKNKIYAGPSSYFDVIRALVLLHDERGGSRARLILDAYTCKVWRYYRRIHPDHRETAIDLERRFQITCVGFTQSALGVAERTLGVSRKLKTWIVLTGPETTVSAEEHPGLRILARRDIERGGGSAMVVARAK